MSGFVRRFSSYPADDVITAIEGINIIDLPPPGSIAGLNQNVIALVGEFTDMSYALSVDANGVISTDPNPVEIFSGQDLVNKVGGFDETLGQFGGDCGNGYAELRNKTFGRLVIVPVNLASASGIRMWRDLPTNKSATDPTPVVPLAAGVVPAGTELKQAAAASERLRLAKRLVFAMDEAYKTGTDGSFTTTASAATQTFSAATGSFNSLSRSDGKTAVEVGDILVVGVIGAGAPQGTMAGTYRVTAVAANGTDLTVQKMDATNFAATTSAGLVYRIHQGGCADSYGPGAGSLMTAQGSYTLPVRPLTNGAGTGANGTDGTWAVGVAIAPVTAAAAASATTWDPLSGLGGKVGPTTAVAYTAAVQKANAVNVANIDALYATAIDALLLDATPASEVAHVWSARKSSTIRTKLKSHVLSASENGVGRTASLSPELDQAEATALTTVTNSVDPGVGANRDERAFFHWPPVKTFVPEAVGKFIKCADGTTTTDGILDTTGDGWMSSIMGNLAPERNPGESSGVTKKVLAPIMGYARGVPSLDLNAWKLLRTRGISGIRMDKTVGPVFQSGITTSLISGQKNIARRKMADYIEDSIGQAIKPFAKLPMSEQFKDSVLGQIDDFLAGLLSADNPAAQRIADYVVDGKSGNTPQGLAKGIFVVIVKVRTLASADFIVVQAEVGEGVVTTTAA